MPVNRCLLFIAREYLLLATVVANLRAGCAGNGIAPLGVLPVSVAGNKAGSGIWVAS